MATNTLQRELLALEKKEAKLLGTQPPDNRLKEALYQKVPQGLSATLEKAFTKAFEVVFLNGTTLIEKTFDKEGAAVDYEAGNFVVDRLGSKKSVRKLDSGARRHNLLNAAATTATGLGLGLVGLGLPDIPLLVGTMLKGIYEIALGYGFSYEEAAERVYMLRLIRTALTGGEEKLATNRLLDQAPDGADLKGEMAATAKALSDALLVEKFIQGLPIVGVVGGFVNHQVYTKTAGLAMVKYKKRYLLEKLAQAGQAADRNN